MLAVEYIDSGAVFILEPMTWSVEAFNIFFLAMSTSKLKWIRKSAPIIGVVTGANWKLHSNECEPNFSGSRRSPWQGTMVPSAV